MIQYSEFEPEGALKALFHSFWFGEDDGQASPNGGTELMLPDGRTDLVFNFLGSVASEHRSETVWLAGQEAYVIGPQTGPRFIRQLGEKTFCFGISFRSGAFAKTFGVDASGLMNATLPLKDVIRRKNLDLGQVFQGISCSRSGLVAWANEAGKKLVTSFDGVDATLCAAIKTINEAKGTTRIADLCDDVGVSRQHLHRLFVRGVGLSPKLYSTVVRFNSALALGIAKSFDNWAGTAADCGYFDQSHLIDDFQRLCGMSPSQFAKSCWSKLHFANPPVLG